MIEFLAVAAMQAAAHDVYGLWLTEAGSSKVEIVDCGDGTPCGYIRWVDPSTFPSEDDDPALRDARNKDESLRDRPIIGLELLSSFERADDRWRRGEIYDPEGGDVYKATLERVDAETLQVEGCIAVLCNTQTWAATTLSAEEEAEAASVSP